MANEFIARKGLIVPTGSINVISGSVTASNFVGTASAAISSSFAVTASYALNASGGSGFPFTGDAVITGSLNVTQGVTASYFKGDGSQLTNLPAIVGQSALRVDGYQFEADGVTVVYALSESIYNANELIVAVGGVVYSPTIDYVFTSNNVVFTEAPPSGSNITIRGLVAVASGSINVLSGSFIGSLFGTSSYALTASYVPGAASDWNTLANKPAGLVSSSTQILLNSVTGTTFSNAAFLFPQDLTIGGDLIVSGNDIRNNRGDDVITFRGTNNLDVRITSGALDVWNGEIRNSGMTAIQMNGQNVDVFGRLRIYGDEVRSSTNQAALILSGNNISTPGSASATGGFVGNLIGTSSWANNAVTSSYASNVLKTKAGSVANTSFGGTPLTASVTFSTAFSNTNYAIAITGEDSRAWIVQSKTTSGFTINSISNIALTGTTYWTCTVYGEN